MKHCLTQTYQLLWIYITAIHIFVYIYECLLNSNVFIIGYGQHVLVLYVLSTKGLNNTHGEISGAKETRFKRLIR